MLWRGKHVILPLRWQLLSTPCRSWACWKFRTLCTACYIHWYGDITVASVKFISGTTLVITLYGRTRCIGVLGPFVTVQSSSLQQLAIIPSTPCSSWGYWSPWLSTSTWKPRVRPGLLDNPLAIFSDDRKQRGVGRYPFRVSLSHNSN